jgi:hypothetical protein
MDSVREIGRELIVNPGARRAEQPEKFVPEGDLMISGVLGRVRSSFLLALDDEERTCTEREFDRLSLVYGRLRDLNKEHASSYPGVGSGVGAGMIAWSVVDGGTALTIGTAAGALARQLKARSYRRKHERFCGAVCVAFVEIAVERVTRLREKIDHIDAKKGRLQLKNARLEAEVGSLCPRRGYRDSIWSFAAEMERLKVAFREADPSASEEIVDLGQRATNRAAALDRLTDQYRCSIARIGQRGQELRSMGGNNTGERVVADFVNGGFSSSLKALPDELDLELDESEEVADQIARIRTGLDLDALGRRLSRKLFGEEVLGEYVPRIERRRNKISVALSGADERVDALRLRVTDLMDRFLAVCERAGSRQTSEALSPVWWRTAVWIGNSLLPSRWQRIDVAPTLERIQDDCAAIRGDWANLTEALPAGVEVSSIPPALDSLSVKVRNLLSRELSYQRGLEALRKVASVDAELASMGQILVRISTAQSGLDEMVNLFDRRHEAWVNGHPEFRRMTANAEAIEEMHLARNALKRIHDGYRERLNGADRNPMLWSIENCDFVVRYYRSASRFGISARRAIA